VVTFWIAGLTKPDEGGCGGIAYITGFAEPTFNPAFCFPAELGLGSPLSAK
jgi:hypothetical protein